jgi:hypothetical protein
VKQSEVGSELDRAFGMLDQILRDGLDHGFFSFTIRSEVVKDRKRRLTIEAGKTLQFTIPEGDLRH